MRGEVVAAALAGEHRIGHPRCQLGAHRAVAHEDEAGARLHGLHRLVGGQHDAQVLLRRQPADIAQDQVVGPRPPALAQRGAAPRRVEALGVDAAPDDAEALEAAVRQLDAHGLGGHHGRVAAVMELAQIAHDGP